MKIYISNIGDSVTEDSLAAVFATYGRVNRSSILSDTYDLNPLCALVEMPNDEEASLAISKLDGSFIDGRIIRAARYAIAI